MELFITRLEVSQGTIIDGNVDPDKILPSIAVAQDMHVRGKLGTDLFNRLQDDIANDTLSGGYLYIMEEFIKPMTTYYTMVEYLPFAAYSVKNNGIFRHSAEYAETISKSEIDFLVNKYRDLGDYYSRRFTEYMCFNQQAFPEYTSNTEDDIRPDKDSTFSGWVL